MQNKNLCVYPGELLLPAPPADLTAWACVACDQHTSQPQYWEEAGLLVGDKPSTLHLILPECYLDEADTRIPRIHETMRGYLQKGVLAPAVQNGFVLTERSTGSGARVGLVALLDLECYDYHKGSQSLVRATEETIETRIPPRLTLRRGAALETSHVLMLMDDPMQSVVEPLFEKRGELTRLYDFPLMLGGGAQALVARGVPAPLALMAGAGVALLVYLLATLLPTALCDVRQVELRVDGNAVILPAMLDSGNLLRDPVTGLPVLVVPRKAARLLFPGVYDLGDLASLPLGFRLLNVRTAAGSALLPLFRPDECRLYLNGHPSEARLLVAVAGPEYGGAQALVPMAALSASFS